MILSAQSIINYCLITPFCCRTEFCGTTFGLGPAGYDVRIAEKIVLEYGDFALASTIEKFNMPNNVLGIVHDKSTWARRGVAVQNTVIEPGWNGYLTLELTMHRRIGLEIMAGCGIAQIIFHKLDHPTMIPYTGKYQNQKSGPQEAR